MPIDISFVIHNLHHTPFYANQCLQRLKNISSRVVLYQTNFSVETLFLYLTTELDVKITDCVLLSTSLVQGYDVTCKSFTAY